MLRNFLVRLFKRPCDKLRKYITISPDGRLVVLCYHRLAEFVDADACCVTAQEDARVLQ